MAHQAGHGVFIRARIKPEKLAEWLPLIKKLMRDVRANEPDTYVFEVMQTDDPLVYLFFEAFKDKEACRIHQEAPYHVAMSPLGWACLDGEPEIVTVTPLAP